MAGWNDVLVEVYNTPSNYDAVREKYIASLCQHTGRNTIAYYSGWLSTAQPDSQNLSISDLDIEGFMNAIQGLDCAKGLDLILHTPGGPPTAAEGIVNYLRAKFGNNIRAIVPQLAMSAGTMIACSCSEIIMGKHSCIGPIDPQFQGIPAHNIVTEFEEAKQDIAQNPENVNYWAIKLQQYPAAFLKTAEDAIALSEVLLREWLTSNMFSDDAEANKLKIDSIVAELNNHSNSMDHGRHINVEKCRSMGLKVTLLEDDPILQDLVLSIHHSEMITISQANVEKIIENQMGRRTVQNATIRLG